MSVTQTTPLRELSANSDDIRMRLRLVFGLAAASVIYALLVLWNVSSFPYVGIRTLLPGPQDSVLAGQSSAVIAEFSDPNKSTVAPVPSVGDRLLTLHRRPCRTFLQLVDGLARLRSEEIPPGGQVAAGTDPGEHQPSRIPSLVSIVGAGPDVPARRFVEITFERAADVDGSDPQRTYVEIRSQNSRELLLTVFWFLCQLGILAAALTSFRQHPSDRMTFSFALMACVSIVAFVGGFHWWVIAATPMLNIPFILCAAVLPASTLHFFTEFPRESRALSSNRRLTLTAIYLPAALGGAVLAFIYAAAWSLDSVGTGAESVSTVQKLVHTLAGLLTTDDSTGSEYNAAAVLLRALRASIYGVIFLAAVYFFITVYRLGRSVVRTRSAVERRQVMGILVASLCSSVPIVYTLWLAWASPQQLALGRGQIPMFMASCIFIVAYAHGMLRNRLIYADEFLQTGRRYALVSAAVTFAVAGVAALLVLGGPQFGMPEGSSFAVQLMFFLIFVLLMAFLLWIRDRVQGMVDQRFFNEKYQLDHTLQQLNKAAAYVSDPSALARLSLTACGEAVGAELSGMYVRDSRGDLRLAGEIGTGSHLPGVLRADMVEGDAEQQIIARRSFTSSDEVSEGVALLNRLRCELLYILRDERGIDGVIVIGRRPSGAAYSPEDIAFVQAIGQMTLLALHSSRANQALTHLTDELNLKVEHIAEQQRQLALLRAELTNLQAEGHGSAPPTVAADGFDRGDVRGNSTAILSVLETARKAARTTSTVLIRGESGTGKELLARVVQKNSDRCGKPFISVNCAALAPSLLESELFGHVKGAFTGAHGDKVGRFQAADGGTLFLDEIGDIPPEMQVRLLRVLQERSFEPVGSNKSVSVDVRLIAATHRDLEAMVADGTFREDLYYRLNVIRIELPPLRRRRDDLVELVFHMLHRAVSKTGKQIRQISPDCLAAIENYSWPGNIRELENAVERAVVLAEGSTLTLEDLPSEVRTAAEVPNVVMFSGSAPMRRAADRLKSDDYSDQPGSGRPAVPAFSSRPADSTSTSSDRLRIPAAGPSEPDRSRDQSRRLSIRGSASVPGSVDELTDDDLLRALEQSGGNKSRAARMLGLPRSTFFSRLQRIRSDDD